MNFTLILQSSEFVTSHIVRVWSEPHASEIYISDECKIHNHRLTENENVRESWYRKHFPVAILLSDEDGAVPVLVKTDDLKWYCNDCSNTFNFKIEDNQIVKPEICEDCNNEVDDGLEDCPTVEECQESGNHKNKVDSYGACTLCGVRGAEDE